MCLSSKMSKYERNHLKIDRHLRIAENNTESNRHTTLFNIFMNENIGLRTPYRRFIHEKIQICLGINDVLCHFLMDFHWRVKKNECEV